MGLYRRIRSGTPDEFVELSDRETWIRIQTVLPDDGYQAVARLLTERGDVEVSVEAGEDLELLRWFPGLRRLAARSLRLRSLDGLHHVSGSLEHLALGDTLRPISLRPVGAMTRLRRLDIDGTWKDLDTIGTLVDLERLGVGSIDLELLRPLTRLQRFVSGLGTVRSLELLPEIGRLELVELYRLRGPHDLAPLGRIATLRYLQLGSTRSITTLPSFIDCPDLRWVALDEMRGITDLHPIADAPNLEVLLLIGMRQLDVEDLRPLVGHPTLRAGVWGLGSMRRNAAAQELLPLPPADGSPMPWNEPEWDGIALPTFT